MLLGLSILALLVGPLVYQAASGRPQALSLLDGFNVTAVTGLVLLAILPDAIGARNWLVPVVALVGFFGPGIGERVLQAGHQSMHRLALLLGAVVLTLHAVTDGAALVAPRQAGDARLLPLAVLLHQIPVGLSLWWLLRRLGRPVVAAVFIGMAVATGAGYFAGEIVLEAVQTREIDLFQAFVGGSLLHVIHHPVDPTHQCTEHHHTDRRFEVAGTVIAMVFLVALLAG